MEDSFEFPSLLYAAAHMVDVAQLDDLDQYEARTIFDAMPEMQAIKQALHDAYHPPKWRTAEGPERLHHRNLAKAGLPESVIAWVLGAQ